MQAFNAKSLPLDPSALRLETFLDELINATAKLEVYESKLNDSKLDPRWFLPTLQRKEALASSLLEGTQATLDGVFLDQVSPDPSDKSLREVSNYIQATVYGYNTLAVEKKFSIGLIKGLHETLMVGDVHKRKGITVGDFRTSQNYIGKLNSNKSITYVPPVPEQVLPLMENLIQYINFPGDKLKPLIRTAIIHAQFETIHPFDDGNGRVGRIMIPLYLCLEKKISLPCFFISEALERDKFKYYTLLNDIRTKGNWSEWIKFFLQTVVSQCEKYISLVSKINALYDQDLQRAKGLVRSSKIVDVVNLLYEYPIITTKEIVDRTEISHASAIRYLNSLSEGRMIFSDGKSRYRTYYYYDLINLLKE